MNAKKNAASMDLVPAGPQPLADDALGEVVGGCVVVRDHRHRNVRDHRHHTTGVVRDHRKPRNSKFPFPFPL